MSTANDDRSAKVQIPLFLSFLLLTSPALPQERVPLQLDSWVVYWDLAPSMDDATRLSPELRGVGAFCYHFKPDGSLAPPSPTFPEAISKLKSLNVGKPLTVWVSVTNDLDRGSKKSLKDPAIVHDILNDPTRRAAHIQDLVNLADQADALEIDYENLWGKDHDAYSSFIGELAQALHARSRRLAVVVQAKTNDRVRDEAGAIDWKAVGAAADIVKVMAYHFHYASGPSGPIAPPDWVNTLTQFALEHIPAEKLEIVLTLSGFDWPAGATAKSIDYDAAIQLAKIQGVALKHDATSGSPHFSYQQGGIAHEVWFEDAQSLRLKMEALRAAGITQIGFWRMGTGDPAFWSNLSSY
jgi:spore germination protein